MLHEVTTPDGRTLAVEDYGPAGGKPVLVQNGTPNSRLVHPGHVADASARGLRLICYNRPGYGGSDPNPGRSVADCAADIRVICEALGITRFATYGGSGGGPHVLATAALLPGMVAAAVALCSLAPTDAEGLDWYAGMGQANADDMRLALADPLSARTKLENDRTDLLLVDGGDLTKSYSSVLSPVDAAVFTREKGDFIAEQILTALAPGSQGWWDDGWALGHPWGFDLSAITVPVLVVHGAHDQFVPYAHGQWLAAHVPGAEAWLLPDDGHLTITETRIGDIHAWLAERL